jgi:hypothetical protein
VEKAIPEVADICSRRTDTSTGDLNAWFFPKPLPAEFSRRHPAFHAQSRPDDGNSRTIASYPDIYRLSDRFCPDQEL